MSYKRAWLLIDSINQAFETPAVTAAIGGLHGGGAQLTEFGRSLLQQYRRIEAEAQALAAEDMAALERTARPTAGPKV